MHNEELFFNLFVGGLEHILGWRPFIFFGRLTFIAYIIHVPILSMVMNFKKAPIFVCNLEIVSMNLKVRYP